MVALWDVATGKGLDDPQERLPSSLTAETVAFSPDGKRMLMAATNDARMLEFLPAADFLPAGGK